MFNLKMSRKKMKKFWNLMLVALVMLGATACTEGLVSDDEKNSNEQAKGVSFYATFGDDDTRAYIDDADGDKTWTTIWEGNETLLVQGGEGTYTFTNTEAEPNKFTSTDAGVESIIGQSCSIYTSMANTDSRMGKKALYVWTPGVEFVQGATIKLESQTSFLRYTYEGEGDVTLKLELQSESGDEINSFRDNGSYCNEITFSGIKGENFVPFWCGVDPINQRTATLSYAIDGVKVKETTINNICWGKVYNLGTLTDPEPENLAKVYLVPNDGWKADDAWFSAHFFNSTDGYADVKLTDEDGDGIYECSVPADMEKVLFCRMNPAYTEFAWNDETVTDRVWNQTADETIGVDPDNYYYILDWAKGVWGTKDGYVAPEEPALSWVLTGSYCSWSETGNTMTETATSNLFVVEDIELATGTEIKVKASHTWDISYGAGEGLNILNADKWIKVYAGSSINVIVAKSGAYDVYFEYAEDAEYSKLYLVEADGDYTTVVEQTENGALIPDEGTEMPTDLVLGIAGSFQGWDVANTIPMVVADGWYVASGVELYKDDEFKIVKDNAWTVSYGGNGAVLAAETGTEYTLVSNNSQNIAPTKNGKFDIYFNPLTLAFKCECVEEYTNLTVNITVDNKAGWNPLYIYLEKDGTALTSAEGALVTDNKYAISGDYIGSSLSCKFISGSKVSEPQNVTITKNGATVTLEETVIKLTVTLNTDNSKQWWGTTMKIHAWSTGTSFDTSWPGNNMTYEGNYTWSVIVPSELVGKTVNYLVHNGNGWQSNDSKVTISANGNTVTGSSIGIN